MKGSLNEGRSLFVLIGLLAFVILGALYYYIVLPKSETKASVTQSIDLLTNETRQLQQRIDALSVNPDEPVNEFELRKKLPKQRSINTLLLSLQEAELISEAKIIFVDFNDYDGLVSESNIAIQREEEEEETEQVENEDDNQNIEEEQEENLEVEKPHTQIDIESLPEQLKLLSLNVEVAVQDYEHLLIFLREIETIEREIRIDDINFSQIGEEGFAEEEVDESILVTIQLTTFYSEEEAS